VPFIAETIASVRGQTRPPLELVCIDDGSTDGTAAVLADLGVRVVSQPNAGVSAARNRGRRELTSSPEYLLFLDRDDVLEPTMIETLESHLDAHPEAGLAYCGLTIVGEQGVMQPERGAWPPRHAPTASGPPRRIPDDEPLTPLLSIIDFVAIIPSVSLMRTSVFDRAGGWDERYVRGGAEDTALAVEMALLAEVHHVPLKLVRYRRHDAQESSNVVRLYRTQRGLRKRLRRREEPQLRDAWRVFDGQLRPRRALEHLQMAIQDRNARAVIWATASLMAALGPLAVARVRSA
jgi:glycosyltransferase involved in cell wall biosynthesis